MQPKFKDAKQHDPDRITLLCGSCHIEATKGLLSDETISECNRRPRARQQGYANHFFDLGGKFPAIEVGPMVLGEGKGISYKERVFLSVKPPEPKSRLWRLSAIFLNLEGALMCAIEENEFKMPYCNFGQVDLEQNARTFRVNFHGACLAWFQIEPPEKLRIRKMVCGRSNDLMIIDDGMIDFPFKQSSIVSSGGRILNAGLGDPPPNLDSVVRIY